MSQKGLRILMLCPKFPYPKLDGGSIAMYNMMQGFYQTNQEVTVLGMSTPKHPVLIHEFPDQIRQMAHLHAVEVDTQPHFLDALASLTFSRNESYHVQRFDSKTFKGELLYLLENNTYDVIQLETLYMTPYIEAIRNASDALIALRTHNIEHEIWRRRARNEKKPWLNFIYSETARRLEIYEKAILRSGKHDVLVPITGRDGRTMKKFGHEKPYQATVSGVIPGELHQYNLQMEFPSVFYLGSLDWEPNREGLRWFLKFVWPRVHRRYPNVPFYIAGRKMPSEFSKLKKANIIPLGEVKDAARFMQEKGIMVSPLFSGSGMRVKIIEGMAYGKPIVATRVAAEGIEHIYHGNQLMIANEVDTFTNCLSTLIEDRNLAITIGKHAKRTVLNDFDNKRHILNLLKFYREQIRKRESGEDNKKRNM